MNLLDDQDEVVYAERLVKLYTCPMTRRSLLKHVTRLIWYQKWA